MLRPDRIATILLCSDSRCIGLAGASPAAVSAGAPRSRHRTMRETSASEWCVKSLESVERLAAKEASPRAQHQVNLAAPRHRPPKGRGGRAAHATAKATDYIGQFRNDVGHLRGTEEGTWIQPNAEQERPVPTAASGEGDLYKPTVKGDRVGRESEGFIVPLKPVDKTGRGKGPCFGHAGVRR
jgi:hypothetical protein